MGLSLNDCTAKIEFKKHTICSRDPSFTLLVCKTSYREDVLLRPIQQPLNMLKKK